MNSGEEGEAALDRSVSGLKGAREQGSSGLALGGLSKMGVVFLASGIAAYLLLTYTTFWASRETIRRLTAEDGLFENLGAAYLLLGAAAFFWAFWLSRGAVRGKRNAVHLAIAILFLLAFMEEISWGQRILGFDTPAVVVKFNVQKEVNIHNLQWFHGKVGDRRKDFWQLFLNGDRLFTLFWVSLCLVIPVLSRASASIRIVLARFGVPIAPVWLGLLFAANYLASKVLETYQPEALRAIVEIKEQNVAFLFLCLGLIELHRMERVFRRSRRDAMG